MSAAVAMESMTIAPSEPATFAPALKPKYGFSISGVAFEELGAKLHKSMEGESPKWPIIAGILRELDLSEVDQQILQKTKLGLTVGQLKKASDVEVQNMAKAIVDKWKKLLGFAKPSSSSLPHSKPGTPVSSPVPPLSSPSPSPSPPPLLSSSSSNHKAEHIASLSGRSSSPSGSGSSKAGSLSSSSSSNQMYDATSAMPGMLVRIPSSEGNGNSSAVPDGAGTPTADGNSPRYLAGHGDFVVGATDDPKRNRVQQIIYEALGRPPPEAKITINELAVRIESAMYNRFKADPKEYNTKARAIKANLLDEKNPDINLSLFTERLAPEEMVNANEFDLASEVVKRQREAERQYAKDATRSDWNKNSGVSDLFQCGKCKQRKCKYYQLQTRSADEPMTTFVTCVNCGHKFRC